MENKTGKCRCSAEHGVSVLYVSYSSRFLGLSVLHVRHPITVEEPRGTRQEERSKYGAEDTAKGTRQFGCRLGDM